MGTISDRHCALLPEDRVRKVHELREKYGVVAMVADGRA